jgi:hypothetical protein
MMTFKSTTDEELITLWHKQAREMSFFNAAECESWYKERVAREACKQKLALLTEEIYSRGMDLPKGITYAN